jgi:SAM-dependent methyltransferase
MIKTNKVIDIKFGPYRPSLKMHLIETLEAADPRWSLHLGSGRDRRELESHVGGTVVSYDIDRAGLQSLQGTTKILGDAATLPFRDGVFDMVFSSFVFEHLPAPHQVLAELDRVLQPGGSFVVLVPNRNHYYVWFTNRTPLWFHRVVRSLLGHADVEADVFPTVHRWGAAQDFEDTARSFGWVIERMWSAPGPTPYTRILPIHPLITLVERFLAPWTWFHLTYLVKFTKGELRRPGSHAGRWDTGRLKEDS